MTETTQDLLTRWIEIQIQATPDVPVLFVSGAQGIGKSTALNHVEQHFEGRLAVLGLDDFYLTQAERKALAAKTHPLFEVRGPPGTHDISFLTKTIHALKNATETLETRIPKFDKRVDDRAPRDAWDTFKSRPVAILVEGWCIGALPAVGNDDRAPLNAIEAQDSSGQWRAHQEAQLAGRYADLWDLADGFFHLSAPSFEQVYDWRLQQEATTHDVSLEGLPSERKDWVRNFIQHYERLTKRMLSGQRRGGYALQVDAARQPAIGLQTPLIVFSDLDGTLLDHSTYSFDAARSALTALRETNSQLVLASSKTATEVQEIRHQVGFEDCPAIVENGAGILEPGQSANTLSQETYQKIRTLLDEAPAALRQSFEGFGDATAEQVAELTGLSLMDAARAKARSFSEPGLWRGTDADLQAFLAHLASKGLTARQGGRFLTFSFGATKADQLFNIASRFAPAPIMALGDAPNDVEMLESANYPVIVKNTNGAGISKLTEKVEARVLRTQDEGPAGWNTAVLDVMQKLGLGSDTGRD